MGIIRMKQIFLALSLVLVGTAAMADEKSEKQLHVMLNQNQRIQALEKRASGAAARDEVYQKKLQELDWTVTRGLEAAEREIAELQTELQRTLDQVAHIVQMQRAK